MSQWGPWLVSSSSPRSGWPETLSLEVSSCHLLPSLISLLQVPCHGQSDLTSWSRWVTGSTPTQGLLYESEDTVSLLSLDPTRSPSQLSSATPTSTTTSSRLLPSTVQVTSRSLPCIPMSVLWYFRTSLYLIVKRIKSSKENPSPASVSFSHIRAPISWWNNFKCEIPSLITYGAIIVGGRNSYLALDSDVAGN